MKLKIFSKYILLSPWEYTIGNAAEHIFYGLLVAKMKKKKLVLIVRQPGFIRKALGKLIWSRLGNKEIFKVQSEGVIVPSDSFLPWLTGKMLDYIFIPFYFIHRVLRKVFKSNFRHFFAIPTFGHRIVFNPDGEKYFSWEKVEEYNWDKVLTEGVPVYISKKKEESADMVRVAMGLPMDCWYVTLHVRETGYYKESDLEAGYRTADIYNYIDAMKYIVSRGGRVVRMGDSSMKALPEMDGVIDYPFTPYKSELMDLYLIQNCRLCIGMDSGLWEVAHMYQKRSILANLTNWCLGFPPKYGDLGILKHFYSKSKGRFLTVQECLEAPYTINYHYGEELPDHGKSDYIIVENTSDEIKQVVAEWLDETEGHSYSELQELFVEKRKEQIKRWLIENPFLRNSVDQSYRMAARYYYKGTVSQRFLEDNWQFTEHLEEMTKKFKQ